MKVLVQATPGLFILFSRGGGDATQIKNTMKEVTALGHSVAYSDSVDADVTEFDVVHLFGSIEPYYSLLWARNAKRQRKPVVLSTIFWQEGAVQEETKSVAVSANRLWQTFKLASARLAPLWARGVYSALTAPDHMSFTYYVRYHALNKSLDIEGQRRELYELADILLPNSQAEYEFLSSWAGQKYPYTIVPNAVDPDALDGDKGRFPELGKYKDGYVLCAGNVCPRKNTRRLIEACASIGVPLVLAGWAHGGYYTVCRQVAHGTDTVFLGYVPHTLIKHVYAGARVHALVSFYETPGLASLEAAAAGCSVVVTDGGCTREYFGNFAHYGDPSSVESIAAAINEAWRTPVSSGLQEKIRTEYTWRRAAEETLKAYRSALERVGTALQ